MLLAHLLRASGVTLELVTQATAGGSETAISFDLSALDYKSGDLGVIAAVATDANVSDYSLPTPSGWTEISASTNFYGTFFRALDGTETTVDVGSVGSSTNFATAGLLIIFRFVRTGSVDFSTGNNGEVNALGADANDLLLHFGVKKGDDVTATSLYPSGYTGIASVSNTFPGEESDRVAQIVSSYKVATTGGEENAESINSGFDKCILMNFEGY